jgi:uncharacterized DUF497 family protein
MIHIYVYNDNVRFEWDEQKAAEVQGGRGITLDDVVDAFADLTRLSSTMRPGRSKRTVTSSSAFRA